MIAPTSSDLAPRTIAEARTERARRAAPILRAFIRAIRRRLAAAAQAWRHHRELVALVEADPRILGDVGLTRGELRALTVTAWWRLSARQMMASGAARRDEARAVARRSRPIRHVASPSLAPSGDEALPVRRTACDAG